MTKEGMKDRISMALKDPILQQGFEIICKENAELKETVTKMNNVLTETFRNLTKAKELLEKWEDLHLTTSVQAETRQFLKENE